MSTLEFSQLLGNYGEFVGAIAIVVTLIYLAIQLKQNTNSVKASAYQEWVSSNVEINMSMSNRFQSQAVTQGSMDASKLTEESRLSFMMQHIAIMQMAQSTDYLYRSGSLDRELWEAEMNRVRGILSFPACVNFGTQVVSNTSPRDSSGFWSRPNQASLAWLGIRSVVFFAMMSMPRS